MTSSSFDYTTNYFFPTSIRYAGYIVTAIGFVATYTGGVRMFFIPLFGVALIITKYGIIVDTLRNRMKKYTWIFGIKFGSWESFAEYPYVTVLEITEKSTKRSMAMTENVNRNLVYRITFLNETHYKKVLVRQLTQKEEAHQEAELIAANLDLEKVIFSPRRRR